MNVDEGVVTFDAAYTDVTGMEVNKLGTSGVPAVDYTNPEWVSEHAGE